MFNDNRRSRCLFCNILPIYKIPCGISNAIINVLEEILQSDPFLMLRNFEEMQGCQWYGVKRIKSIFAHKENNV